MVRPMRMTPAVWLLDGPTISLVTSSSGLMMRDGFVRGPMMIVPLEWWIQGWGFLYVSFRMIYQEGVVVGEAWII